MSEEIKFEKAMERLEKIVESLEAGEVSLDDALKMYEEGVKLSRACQSKLTQAEKKIEILSKSLDGGFEKLSFEDSEEGEDAANKKTATGSIKKSEKEKPKRHSSNEEDLIL